MPEQKSKPHRPSGGRSPKRQDRSGNVVAAKKGARTSQDPQEPAELEDGSHLVRLGTAGRLVIPEPVRRALGLNEGDSLRLRVDGPRLIVATPQAHLVYLQDRLAEEAEADQPSLVDELIEERRDEAKRGH